MQLALFLFCCAAWLYIAVSYAIAKRRERLRAERAEITRLIAQPLACVAESGPFDGYEFTAAGTCSQARLHDGHHVHLYTQTLRRDRYGRTCFHYQSTAPNSQTNS